MSLEKILSIFTLCLQLVCDQCSNEFILQLQWWQFYVTIVTSAYNYICNYILMSLDFSCTCDYNLSHIGARLCNLDMWHDVTIYNITTNVIAKIKFYIGYIGTRVHVTLMSFLIVDKKIDYKNKGLQLLMQLLCHIIFL